MIYGAIEKDEELPYPTMRPAFDDEIVDIQAREVTKAILKAHTKEKK